MTVDLLGLICNSLASHQILSLSNSTLQQYTSVWDRWRAEREDRSKLEWSQSCPTSSQKIRTKL